MLYGIISDVHANLPALEAVTRRLADLGVSRYLCLGDIVGYGASPNECCAWLRDLDCVFVRGNHDEAAIRPGKEAGFTPPAAQCIRWTREVLTRENQEFLATLEPTATVGQIALCHGSWLDQDYYTTSPRDAVLTMSAMPTSLCFFGHTHYAEWYEVSGRERWPHETTAPDGGECQIAAEHMYLINPGSVGQPRDGNSCAGYAVYDDDAQRVTLQRVPYNVAAAQEAILEAGLPPKMATRLPWGV